MKGLRPIGRPKGSGVVPLIDRVMRRVEMVTESGCWIFMGYLNHHGYGKVGAPGKYGPVLRTHRVTYEHYRGPVPEGMQLDHLCRVRSCCNPWHLQPVTLRENIERSPIAPGVKRVVAPYPGIYRRPNGNWCGQVRVKKRNHQTREFATPEAAHSAYRELCVSLGVTDRGWIKAAV